MVDNATIAGGLTAINARTAINASGGLTATGTTIADALQLTAHLNDVTGADSGTGVILPTTLPAGPGEDCIIFNDGSNPIQVYANGVQTIDGEDGSDGVTLTNAKRAAFYLLDPNTWISAQLGVPSA